MRKARWIRRVIAGVMFLAITVVLLDFTGITMDYLGWSVRLQFWPAVLSVSLITVVLVLGMTALFGRVYCSMMCPLGIFQDVIIMLRRVCGFKTFDVTPSTKNNSLVGTILRDGISLFFVGSCFVGLHFYLLEPYAIYARMVSGVVGPIVKLGYNQFALWALCHTTYVLNAVEVVFPAMGVMVWTLGMIVLIAGVALWRGRWWCVEVCPVGTILGWVARVALWRVRIDSSACVECGACARVCKAGAIDVGNRRIDAQKCVACYNCGVVCAKGAIRWTK